MSATQYWKPGEARPKDEERERGHAPSTASSHSRSDARGGRSGSSGKKDRSSKPHHSSKGAKEEGSSRKESKDKGGGRGSTTRRYSDGVVGHNNRSSGDNEVSTSPRTKGPAAGPSQGLLAMKFMQRKVKINESQRQQQEKREKLERDFSSSFAKRLKADQTNKKDRLVCQQDEQDPALVMLGRRSFGGFNVVAETAYEACVRDIAAGAHIGQVRGDANGGGISDTEMAERLGKHMQGGRR